MRTVDPLVISNNILELAFKEKVSVTPMKLQKLLYFVYRNFLQETEQCLFADRFETWKYGPVLSDVYREFSHYKDRQITEYYKNKEGKCYKLNEANNPAFARALHEVWEQYKDYSGIALSNLTHQPGTAWRKAWNEHRTFLSDADIKEEKVEGLL